MFKEFFEFFFEIQETLNHGIYLLLMMIHVYLAYVLTYMQVDSTQG